MTYAYKSYTEQITSLEKLIEAQYVCMLQKSRHVVSLLALLASSKPDNQSISIYITVSTTFLYTVNCTKLHQYNKYKHSQMCLLIWLISVMFSSALNKAIFVFTEMRHIYLVTFDCMHSAQEERR